MSITIPGIGLHPAATPQAPAASAAAAADGTGVSPEVAEAAEGLEGVFMSLLVNEMFKGTELTGGTQAYGGLITQQFGDALADSGGLGLAAMLTRQMQGTA